MQVVLVSTTYVLTYYRCAGWCRGRRELLSAGIAGRHCTHPAVTPSPSFLLPTSSRGGNASRFPSWAMRFSRVVTWGARRGSSSAIFFFLRQSILQGLKHSLVLPHLPNTSSRLGKEADELLARLLMRCVGSEARNAVERGSVSTTTPQASRPDCVYSTMPARRESVSNALRDAFSPSISDAPSKHPGECKWDGRAEWLEGSQGGHLYAITSTRSPCSIS